MHRIAVISDTHGLLRPEILEKLQDCEAILHGGDINRQSILDKLNQIAPVYAVRGNNDKEWAQNLPETLSFTLYGIRIFMVHNKKQIPATLADTDIIIYGHSHKYEEKYAGGQLFLNPGSCGPRRFTQPVTMAMLTIEEDVSFRVEKIELQREQPGTTKKSGAEGHTGTMEKLSAEEQVVMEESELPQNIKAVIRTVIKDIDRGKTVGEIAARNGIQYGLAEQICRLYLTHPGVDADGIMTKMGV
ncbi:MAG: metallophosphatase family protein [Muribaculaceae bacterium]|nr:metallophosphatase family protein [Muribaculaceae bacterium]